MNLQSTNQLTLEHIHLTFERKAKWFWSETSYIKLIALYIIYTQK